MSVGESVVREGLDDGLNGFLVPTCVCLIRSRVRVRVRVRMRVRTL